jgi:hypothetical protein
MRLLGAAGADANRLARRTIFPLSNETEVKKVKNGIDDGTESGEFRRLDEAGAKDRHRNAIQPQVEENARCLEEGASEELAYVLPWDPAEHARLLSQTSAEQTVAMRFSREDYLLRRLHQSNPIRGSIHRVREGLILVLFHSIPSRHVRVLSVSEAV